MNADDFFIVRQSESIWSRFDQDYCFRYLLPQWDSCRGHGIEDSTSIHTSIEFPTDSEIMQSFPPQKNICRFRFERKPNFLEFAPEGWAKHRQNQTSKTKKRTNLHRRRRRSPALSIQGTNPPRFHTDYCGPHEASRALRLPVCFRLE